MGMDETRDGPNQAGASAAPERTCRTDWGPRPAGRCLCGDGARTVTQRRCWPLAGLLWGAAVLLAGCGTIPNSGPGSATTASYLSAVTATGASVVYYDGPMKSGTSGSTLTASGPIRYVRGETGTIVLTSTGTSSIRTFYVNVAGLWGYYKVTLPSAATTASLNITMAQSPPDSSFVVNYTGSDVGGTLGDTATGQVIIVQATGGAVQVTVTWDTDTDVDLHLVEPDGTEIYWGHPSASDGGTLVEDSNTACAIDGRDREVISWPTGTPPSGTYTVRVDYYSACLVPASTHYTVTVEVTGQTTQTYTGTFGPDDVDHGAQGAGRTVATFTY